MTEKSAAALCVRGAWACLGPLPRPAMPKGDSYGTVLQEFCKSFAYKDCSFDGEIDIMTLKKEISDF